MLVAASLALALVPALAYAQGTTATVAVVTSGAQTNVVETNIPQQFVTRTVIFTAPVDQITSYAQAIPTSIQVVVSQPDGGYVPVNFNGFSTSIFIPAAASVPAGEPLSLISPIFAPVPTLVSIASESVASVNSAIVSSAQSGVSQIVESATSLASVAATASVAPIPTPNPTSALSSFASVISSNVALATSVLSAASSQASAAVSNGSVLVASVVSGVSTSVLVATSALPSGASILVDSASSGLVTRTVSSTASTSVSHSGTTTVSGTRTVTSNGATTTVPTGTSSSTAAPNSAASANISGTWESCVLILAAGMVSAFFVLS